MSKAEEYIERAVQQAKSDALRDFESGTDRRDEDTIADTESLIHSIMGKKLHEVEDEEDSLVILLVEAYDEAYIDTFVAEQVAYDESAE